MMAKAMEKYKIAEGVMLTYLNESEQNQDVINNFTNNIETERQSFKKKSIDSLISNTPSTFKDIVGFHDWDSAMEYLLLHQDEAFKFWRIEE
tara:strand:- start:180 stop:455 length:276 start_codon:yes stop_codon:yes gene_type:complete